MKFGIALGRLNPAFFEECTLEAEVLGDAPGAPAERR